MGRRRKRAEDVGADISFIVRFAFAKPIYRSTVRTRSLSMGTSDSAIVRGVTSGSVIRGKQEFSTFSDSNSGNWEQIRRVLPEVLSTLVSREGFFAR